MIVNETGRRTVTVRYRDSQTLERKITKLAGFPYLFVEGDSPDPEYWGLYGESLEKITFPSEWDRREFAKNNETWEANVPYVNQMLADRVLAGDMPFENYEHRVWYLDGEWKTESGEITMLTVHDSYTGKLLTWVQHPEIPAGAIKSMPCKNHPDGIKEITFDTPALAFKDERSLLLHFAKHMNKHDPDIIAGWYLVSADIYQICTRMRHCGIDPKIMSPYNRHVHKYNWTDKNWVQPIPGRICFDLMVGFKKLWTLKNGQLAGQGLDAVAELALGERKVPLEDGHDTYYTDIGTYTDYNRQDVRLLPRLDEHINVLNYFTSLQHLVQCDMATTPMVTMCATSLFLQDEKFDRRIPTRPAFAKVEYEGADIQEPEVGRYSNIAIMDIKAMYHSNINLYNISWDTIYKDGLDCGNGVKFRQGERGLLGRTMDKLTVKRNEYKALMKSDPDNKSKWDAMQFATKSMVASLYGVSGDSKFGMYHPDIASAITFTSRQTLFRLRDECNDRGYPVVYGHTDSIFCEVATPEEGVELVAKINESMYPIETEFEKWAESMVLKAKNRYAGKVTWTDGQYHEPDYYYKGLELIQTRMPKAMKDSMGSILRGILDGDEEADVSARISEMITKGINGDFGNDLLMKGKLKQKLSSYKVLSGASAGVAWAKINLNKDYDVGDSFLTAVDKSGKTMAFDNIEELRGVAEIDWRSMTEKYIVKKACDIYELVGWDTQPLWNAFLGLSKTVWL